MIKEKRSPRHTRSLLARLLASLTATAALLCLIAAPAWAQPKLDNKDKPKEPDAPKVKVQRGKGGKKVYVIKTGFVIEGRIQKPNAFYVLQRSQINYDWAALKQRFVPRILDAVKKSPF